LDGQWIIRSILADRQHAMIRDKDRRLESWRRRTGCSRLEWGMDPMSKPVIGLACLLLFCPCAQGSAAAQDGRFFTVPPFVFPGTPDLRSMLADRPAGFCFAKTSDNRAYLLVPVRDTTRTTDDIEQTLDRIGRDLGLESERFECPPKTLGRSVLRLLFESGKPLQELVVPDEFLDAPWYR
jgi:hypothetical protein